MAINYDDFIHPLDKKALAALKAVPGFDLVVKKFMNIFAEKMFKIESTSSYLKLGPNQLPEIYEILVKVCQKLQIKVPELYLALDRTPNAYTCGDTDIFIVLHSGLIETMTLEQIETVIAHECGHIVCHHVLYRTMGRYILTVADAFSAGILSKAIVTSLQYAFFYWMRCSEFSADRVSAFYHGSSEPVVDVMLALSGGTNNLKYQFNREEFFEQAKSYKALIENSTYNKVLEFIMYGQLSHPLNAYRAYEIDQFYKSNGTMNRIAGEQCEDEYNDLRALISPDNENTNQKFKLTITYEYIKSKSFIKIADVFNNQLEVSFNKKSYYIDKNGTKELKLKNGEYELNIKNSVATTTYRVDLQRDTEIIVAFDSDSKIIVVREN